MPALGDDFGVTSNRIGAARPSSSFLDLTADDSTLPGVIRLGQYHQ
jgi:hypothetical protein